VVATVIAVAVVGKLRGMEQTLTHQTI